MDRVVVMYAGTVVEDAPVGELFREPLHPYTQGLLRSVPGFGDNATKRRLPTIAGMVPDLRHLPKGCRFSARCEARIEICGQSEPPLTDVGGRKVACFVAAAEKETA